MNHKTLSTILQQNAAFERCFRQQGGNTGLNLNFVKSKLFSIVLEGQNTVVRYGNSYNSNALLETEVSNRACRVNKDRRYDNNLRFGAAAHSRETEFT